MSCRQPGGCCTWTQPALSSGRCLVHTAISNNPLLVVLENTVVWVWCVALLRHQPSPKLPAVLLASLLPQPAKLLLLLLRLLLPKQRQAADCLLGMPPALASFSAGCMTLIVVNRAFKMEPDLRVQPQPAPETNVRFAGFP
jgi:hypothetical protein